MFFSKLYLSTQYFQNFTFSSHVGAILMSVKKIYDGLQLKWRKWTIINSAIQYKVSLCQFQSLCRKLRKDKKCKYKFSTPKNPFKDLCFYLSYCLLYDFFYTSLFLFSNLSHFRLLDNIFEYTMKKNGTDEKFMKLLSLQVNQDPPKPKVGQTFLDRKLSKHLCMGSDGSSVDSDSDGEETPMKSLVTQRN